MNTAIEAGVARMEQQREDYLVNLTAVKGETYAGMMVTLAEIIMAGELIMDITPLENQCILTPALRALMRVALGAVLQIGGIPEDKLTETLNEAQIISDTINRAAREN